ncbi:MAG: hypothetical protein IKK66_00750 [Ruminococcus sp.]|nr:hypothetical protein [Ruminococcus sp.]
MQIRYSKQTEQNLIAEMIKRIVLAWDPDFTKVTPEEKKILDKADEELKNGEYYSHDEVWADI